MLTGVFPGKKYAKITSGPLSLVKCSGKNSACGLLQLEYSYDSNEMYGENYGYRSGLNSSMVLHLQNKIKKIIDYIKLEDNDLVIDIGSNDSTTLQSYPPNLILLGVDPTGDKFKNFYPSHISLIVDFFSSDLIIKKFNKKKAKIITSFSMFYDLEDPMSFMLDIFNVLDDDGIWVFEQSYMPLMLQTNSFDTVCHEHLEFYGLAQIKWMADKIGFNILDVELNDINGGSFSIIVSKSKKYSQNLESINKIIEYEKSFYLDTLKPYEIFSLSADKVKNDLLDFLNTQNAAGKKIAALGASTKGNVLLQFCNLTEKDIFAIGEVNPDKHGKYTPGSWIPIIAEDELLSMKPDYLLVLPWHFRKFFEKNKKYTGLNLVFAFPKLEVVKL